MHITASIKITSCPKDVFSWIDDPDRAMHWQKGIRKGKILNETPGKTGTTFIEELEENGKILFMHGEITNYTQDKQISFHLDSKMHSVFVDYSVSGSKNESTVLVDSIITWKFPMSIVMQIAGKKIETKILEQLNTDLAELKKLCEMGFDL